MGAIILYWGAILTYGNGLKSGMNILKHFFLWIALLIIVVLALSYFSKLQSAERPMGEVYFVSQLNADNIESVTMTEVGTNLIEVKAVFKEKVDNNSEAEFKTNAFRDEWKSQLEVQGIPYEWKVESTPWQGILFALILVSLFLALVCVIVLKKRRQTVNICNTEKEPREKEGHINISVTCPRCAAKMEINQQQSDCFIECSNCGINFKTNNITAIEDFFTFKTMLTPILLQFVFWFGSFLCVSFGVILVMKSEYGATVGVILMIGGPLILRIFCEWGILFFRMNETMTEILNKMK